MSSTALLATQLDSEILWRNLPEAWVLVMLILPAVALISWWGYARERDLSAGKRLLLGGLRLGAFALFLVLLFGPFANVREQQSVRAHLLVLLDVSDSMSTVDGYEPADAAELAAATGQSPDAVTRQNRLDLAKATFLAENRALLKRLNDQFRVHVLAFGTRLTPVVSGRDASEEPEPDALPDDEKIAERLSRLAANAPATRLGQAVGTVLDMFHYRDEPVAGVVVISDGQQNGGSLSPVQAGRKAATQHVPVFTVGVGDPRSPKNLSVSNLRAKEVVLARDTALFEFTVRGKGFAGRNVPVELHQLGSEGEPVGSPLLIDPSEIVLGDGEKEQVVKVAHRFLRAGTYSLRLGIPVQDEEKIKSDNYVLHTIRVIDRKIKVLYIDSRPRFEYLRLSRALVRDTETMLAHVLLLDAAPGVYLPASQVSGWSPLTNNEGIPTREALFEYDVIVLGDVDPRHLAPTSARADDALDNLREFVDKGGGLILLSGPENNPTKYLSTPLEDILPIVVSRSSERAEPRWAPDQTFPFQVTSEGERSPMMDIALNPELSKKLWETSPRWQQYWTYPADRAKALANVLMVSKDDRHDNRHGKRPLVATMRFGRGHVLYLGIEELWRTTYLAGDQYFYGFYGEAIRYLATYKLLGGNKRFKIMTDRDQYTLDDRVRITLDVLDRDYQPAREPVQKVTLDMPGETAGTRETVELEARLTDDERPGTYATEIVPTRPGDYRLSAESDDPEEDAPEKLFHVVRSSLEGRDLLLDEATLRDLAEASDGGAYMHLKDMADELRPVPRTQLINTDSHRTELWDNWYALLIALGLLGAEWGLRKRWHLV